MERESAIRWLCVSAPLGVLGAALPFALVYLLTGSLSGVLYLAVVCGLLMLPMFTLVLYWGYRLRVAAAATPGWNDQQRRGLVKGTIWITASVIPAFFAVAGLGSGLSAGDGLALALYSGAQFLGLRCLASVYTSKLAQASSRQSDALSLTPPMGLAYGLLFAGALLGCLAIVLLYSGRLNGGTLASVAAAMLAAAGARKLLNLSRAA